MFKTGTAKIFVLYMLTFVANNDNAILKFTGITNANLSAYIDAVLKYLWTVCYTKNKRAGMKTHSYTKMLVF